MSTPEYLRVYEMLKRQITDDELRVGDRLPPEPELCRMFSVSRTTVRKAVSMLVDDGFLEVQQGRGTTVISNRTVQFLNTLTSFSETMRRRGIEARITSVKIELIKADAKLASTLMLNVGDTVAYVCRTAAAEGAPISVLKNYIDYERVRGIETQADRIQSLYKFWSANYGILIDSANDRISAINATPELAAQLGIGEHDAVMCQKRITFYRGLPVSRDISLFRGDKYEFQIFSRER